MDVKEGIYNDQLNQDREEIMNGFKTGCLLIGLPPNIKKPFTDIGAESVQVQYQNNSFFSSSSKKYVISF